MGNIDILVHNGSSRNSGKSCVHAKSLQSCLTLCDPMDCSPPGSSVPGILQARILEWVAIPSSSLKVRDDYCEDRTVKICRRIDYEM